jgi:flagellar motor switch protein FliN/FliY
MSDETTQKPQEQQLPSGKDLNLQDLPQGGDTGEGGNAGLEAIYDVPVVVKAVLGTREMPINELLKLGRGAVVDLDRKVGDAVDVYVNDRLVARGEVVIVEDRLGITMTEIVKSQG